MWNNDEDINEDGNPVLLYLPMKGPRRKTDTAPRESHIGGLPFCFVGDETHHPRCGVSGEKMILLAQLRMVQAGAPERHLCVFVSPREELFDRISYNENGFASTSEGLNGVVRCTEKFVPNEGTEKAAPKPTPAVVAAPVKSSWYNDDSNNDNGDGDGDGDDWGMGGDDDDDAGKIDLESAVAAMEEKLDVAVGAIATSSSKKSPAKKKKSKSARGPDESLSNAFGCYVLQKQDEPASSKSHLEDEDDVVGLSVSDEKVRNMLARYMAEEEDEDILAALRGGGGGSSGSGNNNNGEEDERLSEEDRILRGFQDRQKRAPRQVIRYAWGGRPLWSIPDKKRGGGGKRFWNVPGSFTFEFQVLPSVLTALEVDKHPSFAAAARKSSSSDGNNASSLDQLLSGGVNFGSIAVFTDSSAPLEGGGGEREAFVVIQKGVDDLPEQLKSAAAAGGSLPAASMAVVEDLDDDDEFVLDS